MIRYGIDIRKRKRGGYIVVPDRHAFKSIQALYRHYGPFLLTSIGVVRIADKLGSGGFGSVYRAFTYHNDELAVKQAKPNDDIKFEAEVQQYMSELTDHVAPVYDLIDDGEWMWIVMPIYPESLGDLEVPIYPRQVVRYMRQLAFVVNMMRMEGISHRDIKPENVMLDMNDDIVLIDFGIAITDCQDADDIAGTLTYMAPELLYQYATGKPRSQCNADIWSMGAVMYYLLTGQPLIRHRKSVYALFEQATSVDVKRDPRLRYVPTKLVQVLDGMLQVAPQARYSPAHIIGMLSY